MKLSHKVNHGWAPDRTDPAWADRVEREAEDNSDKAAIAYAKARRRLEAAVERAERAQSTKKPDRKKVKALWAAVEARRQELLTLQGIMQGSPGGHQKHRPVPGMGTL